MKLLLMPVLLSAVGQQMNDGEKMFRAMQEKIAKADAVQFTFEASAVGGRIDSTSKGTVVFAQGGRARMGLYKDEKGSQHYMGLVSDGTGMRVVMGERMHEAQNTPKLFRQMLEVFAISSGTFFGMITSSPNGVVGREQEAALTKFVPSHFQYGKLELVNGREAQVVRYKVKVEWQPDPLECQVWISPQTLLPLKRTLHFQVPDPGHITETYHDFRLNPTLDAKVFVLPK